MISSVFLLGTEACINILLVTISGRDSSSLNVPPLLSSPVVCTIKSAEKNFG